MSSFQNYAFPILSRQQWHMIPLATTEVLGFLKDRRGSNVDNCLCNVVIGMSRVAKSRESCSVCDIVWLGCTDGHFVLVGVVFGLLSRAALKCIEFGWWLVYWRLVKVMAYPYHLPTSIRIASLSLSFRFKNHDPIKCDRQWPSVSNRSYVR